ncbi:23S rRNA (guanosine(2251)-2'-O)-methyltransferase RlmB [Phenylobacterium immobile]|uniref:23S rRNA (guanosine(2251)-2'-O)-methyltransferase RlmB n=1 Tax=Phenylobacterium immobile TaxID=21 RepID=UPI000AC7E7E2|nr:23S rRNA (guanosine(2251)-2'-O)-methyltransferase RlmB [Phenylobacterium immobile]
MSSSHERNAPKRGFKPRPHGRPDRPSEKASEDWLWGLHAVEAALVNPARTPEILYLTADRAKTLSGRFKTLPTHEIVDNNRFAQLLPASAVHQGIALKAPLLEPADLTDFVAEPGAVLLMLDQVTDPQNVGAILRSAAAFGAKGLVLQDRHAPQFTGTVAKAAAGAVERVPTARVVNLSRALEELSEAGWRTIGLAGEAQDSLADSLDGSAVVIVLGSEGEGLRRLVAEHCDTLAKIPMPGGFESLNVSAAAAVALYETSQTRRRA